MTHRFLNFTDYTGKLHTQQTFTERKAELWAKWREMRDRNEAVKRYGVHRVPSLDKVNQIEELKMMEHGNE